MESQQFNQISKKSPVIIVVSILLTAIIIGGAVYFWQKSSNEKVVSNLEQKISELEQEISTVKMNNQANLHPTGTPVQNNQTLSQSQSTQQSKITFTNSNGKYGFDYPSVWKAAVNQHNSNNSLFGPNANSDYGLGGVEVFPNQTSIDSFLGGVDAQYTNKTNVTVDGVLGIRARHKSLAAIGEAVVLLKGGKIYNIFVNSEKADDINLFNQIVLSFKFTQ